MAKESMKAREVKRALKKPPDSGLPKSSVQTCLKR